MSNVSALSHLHFYLWLQPLKTKEIENQNIFNKTIHEKQTAELTQTTKHKMLKRQIFALACSVYENLKQQRPQLILERYVW
ncbi:hypothetical protein AQUCO_01800178v1 [Aquilegia coerulea]|uniref:Uncharacterized protein n=1 Tax=Aquilegia coerulea TaxID=218851 RepID=A0A2G5DKD3_AQUCA|nr:hypothetical protein AQUCO_01800178v1 [Aquilegia coerulea]